MKVAQASKAAFCSALLFLSWAAQAGGNRIRLECKADSADELVGMDGEYEERIGRRPRLSAWFEAAPSIGHRLEDVLRTMVDGHLVGVSSCSFRSMATLPATSTSIPASIGTMLILRCHSL